MTKLTGRKRSNTCFSVKVQFTRCSPIRKYLLDIKSLTLTLGWNVCKMRGRVPLFLVESLCMKLAYFQCIILCMSICAISKRHQSKWRPFRDEIAICLALKRRHFLTKLVTILGQETLTTEYQSCWTLCSGEPSMGSKWRWTLVSTSELHKKSLDIAKQSSFMQVCAARAQS